MVVLLTAFQVSPSMCSCAAVGSSHPGSAHECLLAGLEAKRAGLQMRVPKQGNKVLVWKRGSGQANPRVPA